MVIRNTNGVKFAQLGFPYTTFSQNCLIQCWGVNFSSIITIYDHNQTNADSVIYHTLYSYHSFCHFCQGFPKLGSGQKKMREKMIIFNLINW